MNVNDNSRYGMILSFRDEYMASINYQKHQEVTMKLGSVCHNSSGFTIDLGKL